MISLESVPGYTCDGLPPFNIICVNRRTCLARSARQLSGNERCVMVSSIVAAARLIPETASHANYVLADNPTMAQRPRKTPSNRAHVFLREPLINHFQWLKSATTRPFLLLQLSQRKWAGRRARAAHLAPLLSSAACSPAENCSCHVKEVHLHCTVCKLVDARQ